MEVIDIVFLVAVIVMSAVVHEVMHGVAANSLGDPTARLEGRLTLNPLPHLDLFGSIILPAIFVLTQSPLFFAWAKPVPYNPYNLRGGRFSEAIVAGAGPLANLAIALLAGLLLRLGLFPGAPDIIFTIVVINVMLFIFNLIPIPPLDGSKVIEAFLPGPLQYAYAGWRRSLELNPFLGFGIVVLIIVFFGGTFGSFVYQVARGIAGV
ncbi:MAG: site-2 protease family protein [Candidatus Kaiserbacteria bacterium]|nr:MAG: site-2 protease family protein [Candidatus Kaiserbacteria bacterium]